MFSFLNPQFLIETFGMIGIALIIFAETGLFFGFFFPGDSLLFTAGLFASQGYFNFAFLFLVVSLSAILGDNFGYWFGKKVGPKIFIKEESFFFRRSHIERAKKFYQKYGAKTIIFARFVPIIRTFAPILAGVGEMSYKKFILFNIVGGIIWAGLFLGAGFVLGASVPNIEKYFLPIITLIIVLSFLPIINEYLNNHKKGKSDNSTLA